MAMSLCVRALRLTRAARPLLLGRAACLTRPLHTATRHTAGASSVTTGHHDDHHLEPREEHEPEEVDNMYLKNPDSFGYCEDPEADAMNAHWVFFFSVTLCLVFGTLFVSYMPDSKSLCWAQREAERLVKLRDAQGLPFIPRDYYDPNNLVLPDDEE